jgi:hypothetical protein
MDVRLALETQENVLLASKNGEIQIWDLENLQIIYANSLMLRELRLTISGNL